MIQKGKILQPADQMRLNKEIKIIRKVRHSNIIQLFEILEDRKYIYVITEYSSGGELFELISARETLTEPEAGKFLLQLLNAVEYMHEIGVVHRDLKPENLLLDDKSNLKVIDFGLSNIYFKGEMLLTACGSPCYAAP